MSINLATALAILLAANLGNQAMPRSFDLVCRGERAEESLDGKVLRGLPKPKDMRLRVDLVTRQWCMGTCRAAGQVELRDGLVVLDWGKHAALPTYTMFEWPAAYATTYIRQPTNRTNLFFERHYHCQPARFSGF